MDEPDSRFDIITDPVEFRALQPEWNELWSRADGRHHLAFVVCWLCWTKVAQPRGRKLCCITLREQGRLVMVWPLVVYRKLCWTVVRPLASESTDYTNILVQDGPTASKAIERAWDVVQKRCGADIILLPFLNADSRLFELASTKRGVVTKTAYPVAVAMLRGETDWNTFSSSLGRLFENKPGALERRLSKKGNVRIRFLGPEDGEENARLVDWMFDCKRQWADRVNKKGEWLYSMEYRDFLVALLNQTDGAVIARLVVVSLDDTPLAVNIFGLGKTCVDDLIAGFDSDYSRLSPGAIATEHCIKWALEHHLDLDFGAGSEKHKGYWSRNHILTVWSMEIANTWWGLLAFQGDSLRRRFRRQPAVDKRKMSLLPISGSRNIGKG
ncbi:MAG TPA: GNAT family N-acetyltransferase [Trinickia sp.]|jgi:CelD/BcsL family acetyltransferase involved in cellulose biosynthesis|uniref:GNAT family N-acetyltransferase n=1 Tax=Trinickia sp. TaxID=2571163 RepID=UPI002BFB0FA4|nr:GNAT family N-acetyltransferase [Trinickia sp.]HTI17297.1 GNAT family N-acetyltransferase [Trinickia sp.]